MTSSTFGDSTCGRVGSRKNPVGLGGLLPARRVNRLGPFTDRSGELASSLARNAGRDRASRVLGNELDWDAYLPVEAAGHSREGVLGVTLSNFSSEARSNPILFSIHIRLPQAGRNRLPSRRNWPTVLRCADRGERKIESNPDRPRQ